jgi:D-alanyl-D-alanine endopeptidase (penicillin-binding protein 7)
MDSFFLTIAILFSLFNIGAPLDFFIGDNRVPKEHLTPSANVIRPYRVRGSDNFDISKLTAKSFIVADESTGRTLLQKNIWTRRPIASLTKLMTALVWLDLDGNLDKTVEISSADYRAGSVPYFIAGERVLARDLFYTGLVASSNSAIAALARSSGLSEVDFVENMNDKAKELGMNETVFVETTGLDARNISTAHDLQILVKVTFANEAILRATQMKEYSFTPQEKDDWRKVASTNWLLNGSLNDGAYKIIGGKTGHIEEGGYNLVVKVFNKERNRDIFVIILDSANIDKRFSEASQLIKWTYKNYLWEI